MKHNVGKVILGVVSALLLTLMVKGPEISAQDLRTKEEIEATKDWGYNYEYIPIGTKEELIAVLKDGFRPKQFNDVGVEIGRYAYLTNDIDLSGVNWIPADLYGVFDGNGHVIKNLTVHTTEEGYKGVAGLFKQCHLSSVVRNLGLENVNITADKSRAGGIIGIIGQGGWVSKMPIMVENCYVTGKITASDFVGGLVGSTNTDSGSKPITIKQSMTDIDATITGEGGRAGGIIGSQLSSGVDCIKDCLVKGNNGSDKYYLAGICGDFDTGEVKNCIISSPSYWYAMAAGGYHGRVSNCYYNSQIKSPGALDLSESILNSHSVNSNDINKMDTYTDLDFNNIWGIDPAINNGTIFLKTIPFAYALSPIQIGSTDNSNGSKQVSVNCGVAGATIYYSTDGTIPTTSSTVYTGTFECWGTKKIQAIAVLGCYKPSPVATVTVQAVEKPDGKIDSSTGESSINGTVAKPKANYSSHTSMKNLKVKLSTSTSGATIYYTTNGKTPTTSSKKYTKPITIKKNTTLKLIAVKEGYTTSKVATYKYKIVKPKVSSQTYNKNKTQKKIKLSCALSKTTIYYTTNGKKPTKSSKKYNAKKGILLTKNATIKYIAVKGKQVSDVCSTKIYYQVPTPKASKPSSNIKKGTKIILSTSLKGARIYYTMNGKKPTTKSKIYKKPLVINKETKLQYIAVRKGIKSSKVVTTIYQVK